MFILVMGLFLRFVCVCVCVCLARWIDPLWVVSFAREGVYLKRTVFDEGIGEFE